jgi:hypothetical protein
MIGRLFEPTEEHLQYRTYYYREPYVNCFVVQSGEEGEPDPVPDKPKPKPLAAISQAPKKKISLSDWKAKQSNGVSTPASKKPSPDLAPTKPSQPHTNGVKPPAAKEPPVVPKPAEAPPRKR